jgi:16S rRNA (guanine1207-N2)-methyltransferase
MLPKDRVAVLTGFKPDHDHFAAQGFRMAAGASAAAIVCLPRAKADALALLSEAMGNTAPGGPVLVDGQKTDGVDALLKLCRSVGLRTGEVLSKAHGKAFALRAGPVPADWAAIPRQIEGGFTTWPGVFSADGIDRGSALLAAALPAKLHGRVADLGAGWGFLTRAILLRDAVKSVDIVEAEAAALDCARLNVTDPRAQFHWADATTFKPALPWDHVVMNPPFHTSRAADPGLGLAFVQAAQRNMLAGGTLWLVANRHLPYDRMLTGLFRDVEEIGGDVAFRVTRAAVPLRVRPGKI